MIFEPDQGWVPVDTNGTVWRYRTRGSSGVIVFKREGEGQDGARSYEATHLDRFSNDQTITTPSRRKAVRFAITGTTKRAGTDHRLGAEGGAAGKPAPGEGARALGHEAPEAAGGPAADNRGAEPSGDGADVIAVPESLYATDAHVVELRHGEYWVHVPGASGPPVVTVDPSRASNVAQLDAALLGEMLAAVPTARVLKIRVAVTELREHARRDGVQGGR